ncbi:MAG: radical SAM family heme chaperone HemW [Terriglobales bacterium]
MSLGLYLSAPFCRSKCSYCNFASQVSSPAVFDDYCTLLARELELASVADGLRGAVLDTIYWGGGTPSLLPEAGFRRVLAAIRANFSLAPDVEHTLEVAPGTLAVRRLDLLAEAGVNRLSLGVQSFQDAELRAVGRLHRANTISDDIARARAAGFSNISLDLIAGLPHQTESSWRDSVRAALATSVPHLSLYMFEVDQESRLGSELLSGGSRYHANAVPSEDVIADSYEWACNELTARGWQQYEISNFARSGFASRHNQRYWLRQPYLGCGLDAHSFLIHPRPHRFSNPDALLDYCAPLRAGRLPRHAPDWLTPAAAREEYYFLGLRRTCGVALRPADPQHRIIPSLLASGLLQQRDAIISLTARGRMLSNRVLAEFLEPVA